MIRFKRSFHKSDSYIAIRYIFDTKTSLSFIHSGKSISFFRVLFIILPMTEKYASRVGLTGTMATLKLKIKNTEYDRNTLAVAINLIEFQNLNFLYPKKELFS